MVENESVFSQEQDENSHASTAEENGIVVDVDDDASDDEPGLFSKPRRTNSGAGVERLQMYFQGKEYGAKQEFNCVLNGQKEIEKAENDA